MKGTKAVTQTVKSKFINSKMFELIDAMANPFANKRNIYFGLIMGVSAMLPACGHVFFFLLSFFRTIFLQKAKD